MSNNYWSDKDLEKINEIVKNAAHNEKCYSRLRWSALVLCLLNLAFAVFNTSKLDTGWTLALNVFVTGYMFMCYRRNTCSQQLWCEVRHHAMRSMLETEERASWHARRMRDCAEALRKEVRK